MVCGLPEKQVPDIPYRSDYPFMPGGYDPMEGQEFVIATEAIHDPELERNVYGAGDRVPMADAIKYGLVPDERAHSHTEDRAKKPAENRAKKARKAT